MLKKLGSLFVSETQQPVIIVSGLPRSGTSMMMQILVAGGLEAITDRIRTADGDNPKGYYEFERVKNMQDGDVAWLDQARGKVVKIISALLPYLPGQHQYRVVFMRRTLSEVLLSQKKMLQNRGEDPNRISDEEMGRLLEKHVQTIDNWMVKQPNIKHFDVDYNALLSQPLPILSQLNEFFGGMLDMTKMEQVIDHSLYRHRTNT